MRLACPALEALATVHVHLSGDKVSFFYGCDLGADCSDMSAEFMARNEWRMDAILRPLVPVIDMQISPADGCDLHLDQNIAWTKLRPGNLAYLSTRPGLGLDDRDHLLRHEFENLCSMLRL